MFVDGKPAEMRTLPRFTKHLEDIEVADGQEVMLFCIVSGQPMPTVTWYHNGRNIATNEEYVFTYDRQTGHVYLVILDCLADDDGEFQCVAANALGQAVTKCQLRVLPAKSASPFGKPLSINVTSVKQDIVSPTVSETQLPKPRSTSAVMLDNAAVNGRLASTESLTLVPPDILFHTKKIPGQSKKVASYRTVLRRASDNDLLGYRAKFAADQPLRQNVSWKVSDWSSYAKQTVRKPEEVPLTQSKMLPESKPFLSGSSGSLQPAPVTGLPSIQTEFHSHSPGGITGLAGVRVDPGSVRTNATIKSSSYSQPSTVSSYPKAPVAEITAGSKSLLSKTVSYVKAGGAAESASFPASSRLFEPPRFIVPLTNQTARDGDAAMLRVRYHGNPAPQVHRSKKSFLKCFFLNSCCLYLRF